MNPLNPQIHQFLIQLQRTVFGVHIIHLRSVCTSLHYFVYSWGPPPIGSCIYIHIFVCQWFPKSKSFSLLQSFICITFTGLRRFNLLDISKTHMVQREHLPFENVGELILQAATAVDDLRELFGRSRFVQLMGHSDKRYKAK